MEQGNTYMLLKKAESDEQWLKKAMFCYKQALKPFQMNNTDCLLGRRKEINETAYANVLKKELVVYMKRN